MLKRHFSHAFADDPDRLHFAAHSHHLWPDVTFEAQQQHWLDAARMADSKWDKVLGEEWPEAQAHIARLLRLSHPKRIAVAPSVHDFVTRIFTCFEGQRRPVRILSTDSEFHSFSRQARRWEEAGVATVERVAVAPFETFQQRFAAAIAAGGHDLVYFSQVFYNSAFAVPDPAALVEAIPDPETFVVIDGYHGFMALPTDLSAIEERAFYTAGGYKYAMSGEGICFMHCPPGFGRRPVDTGWFAAFGELTAGRDPDRVPFSEDGYRFFGATFDHTGLYRFNAVQRLLQRAEVTVDHIHRHVVALQKRFLAGLHEMSAGELSAAELVPPPDNPHRGHFLVFRTAEAGDLHRRLADAGVGTDFRDDRLRLGFGVYQEPADVDRLLEVLQRIG
ncbi:MAG: aminotransferase [Acidobacteriota bacterium]